MGDVRRARRITLGVLLALALLTALISLAQGEPPWKRALSALPSLGRDAPDAVDAIGASEVWRAGEDTRVCLRTLYSCGHATTHERTVPQAFVGMTKRALERDAYPGWTLVEASLTDVTLVKAVDQPCPEERWEARENGRRVVYRNIDGGDRPVAFPQPK